jgi:hypothetical protein
LKIRDNDYLHARDNGYLHARDNDYLHARDNGYLHARDNGYLHARDNGYLHARDNGYLQARDNDYLHARQEPNPYHAPPTDANTKNAWSYTLHLLIHHHGEVFNHFQSNFPTYSCEFKQYGAKLFPRKSVIFKNHNQPLSKTQQITL